MRFALLTAAVLCAVLSAALVFGWPFLIFDDWGWRKDWNGWLAASVALFAFSYHPFADAADDRLDRFRASTRSR